MLFKVLKRLETAYLEEGVLLAELLTEREVTFLLEVFVHAGSQFARRGERHLVGPCGDVFLHTSHDDFENAILLGLAVFRSPPAPTARQDLERQRFAICHLRGERLPILWGVGPG